MDLREGQILEGEITRIVDEAAFVDIGTAYEAVIPRKDLDRLDPDQLEDIREGESIQVRIVHLPDNGGNPFVSPAQVLDYQEQPTEQPVGGDPWQSVQESYQVGDLVTGIVKTIKKYGAFVELPVGVDGLIHVSEMQSDFTPSPWDVVEPGERITVRIIKIEPERKRIGLSLKDVSQQ